MIILILCAFLISPCLAEADLPSESTRLINLLKNFEAKEQQKADAIIDKKRLEVIQSLTRQLKQRTKNGQLDLALSIRTEIEKIERRVYGSLPSQIKANNMVYKKKTLAAKLGKNNGLFAIDNDGEGGKLNLVFEHAKLAKFLSAHKKIKLVFRVAESQYAGSLDTIILRHKNKILVTKKGVKRGELVSLSFEPWLLVGILDVAELELSNSGSDGLIIKGYTLKDGPVLMPAK